MFHSTSKLGTKQYAFVIRLYKIKEPPSPAPIETLTFDFFYYSSILFKKKDYRNPTTFGRSPRIFDLSYSRSKKGRERSIKVLTPSPKTSTLNLQLIEEDVIITN